MEATTLEQLDKLNALYRRGRSYLYILVVLLLIIVCILVFKSCNAPTTDPVLQAQLDSLRVH